jgi:hypothetical protein
MLADIDKETVDFEDNYDGHPAAADRAAIEAAEPADQRLVRDRRRHGDEHPAAPPR